MCGIGNVPLAELEMAELVDAECAALVARSRAGGRERGNYRSAVRLIDRRRVEVLIHQHEQDAVDVLADVDPAHALARL
jgi:hypothetical protein